MDGKIVFSRKSKVDRVVSAIENQISEGLLRPGDKLMSVRGLSSHYGFNFRTILAALKTLLAKGLIVKSVKVYVVAATRGREHLSGARAAAPSLPAPDTAPHPFLSLDAVHRPSRSIKIAVYENLPRQKACWGAVAEKFRAGYPGRRLEIIWVPNQINSAEAYSVFLKEEKADLALLSDALSLELPQRNLLSPLPDRIARKIAAPEYLASHIEKASPESARFVATAHFAIQAVLVNRDTIEGGLELGRVDMDGLVGGLAAAGERLKPGAAFSNVPWEFAMFNGLPESPCPQARLDGFLRGLYACLSKFRPLSRRCVWKTGPAADILREFAAGNVMLHAGSFAMTLHDMAGARSNWRGVFFEPGEGRRLPCGTTGVALMRSASSGAEEALDFLTSPEAQALFTERRVNASCYLETNKPMLDALQADAGQFLANVRRLSVNKTPRGEWHHIKTFEMMDLTRRVIDAEIDPDRAADEAMEYLRRAHPDKIDRNV